jgi:predicted acetyltransferase
VSPLPGAAGGVHIEPVGPERLDEVARPIGVHIGLLPTPGWKESMATLEELDTRFVALEDDRVVGGMASYAFELTVPGGPVAAAGLSLVGVLPTHRRRGILSALMRRYLDTTRARGQAVSALWASEGPIYGRFGYGLASLSCEIDVPRAQSAMRPALQAAAGTAPGAREGRLLDDTEAELALPPLYERVRIVTPGMLSRTRPWWHVRRVGDLEWQRRGRGPLQRVLLEQGGQPEAYALYRHAPRFEHGAPTAVLEVQEAIGLTPRGTRAIWEYLFSVDLVERVQASFLPVDHPLVLMLTRPERLQLRAGNGLWVRLVDVPRALAARAYGANDELVLEVRDAFCPWNEGRWRLAGPSVERTSLPAELRLDVAALGSLYLGGFTATQLHAAGQAEELAPGALSRTDALFQGTRAPWCPEIF